LLFASNVEKISDETLSPDLTGPTTELE